MKLKRDNNKKNANLRQGRGRIRPARLFFILSIIVTIVLSSLLSLTALDKKTLAEPANSEISWTTMDSYIKDWLLYKGVVGCLQSNVLGVGYLTEEAITGYHLFSGYDTKIAVGNYLRKDMSEDLGKLNNNKYYPEKVDEDDWDGIIKCYNPNIYEKSFKKWGIDTVEFLCAVGHKPIGKDTKDPEECKNTYNSMTTKPKGMAIPLNTEDEKNELKNKIDEYIKKKAFPPNGVMRSFTKAEWFIFYRGIVNNSCIVDIVDYNKDPSRFTKNSNSTTNYTVNIVNDSNGDLEEVEVGGTLSKSSKVMKGQIQNRDIPKSKENYGQDTCENIVEEMNKYAEDYSDLLKNSTTISIPTPTSPGGGVGSVQSTCNIEGGLGWILCPVINTMAKIADSAYGYVEKDFLIIEKDLLGETTETVWKNIVNLANFAFVIVFLIIIFSQLTSFGLSNYGVKTMLPKLIAAVILVNLSFIICQTLVDLSNLIGSQVNGYFGDIAKNINENITNSGGMPVLGRDTSGMGGLAAGVLMLGAAVIFMSISTLIPMLIGVIIAIVMIMLILVARKALVVILTIISPLAFVAYLLPNTKKLFDSWKKAFTATLLVYPITALIFAGSKLASHIILNIADKPATSDDNKIMEIIGSSIAVLPLFVVPGVLKKSLDGIAGLGNIISKMDKSAAGLGKSGVGKIQKKYSESDYGKYRADRKADKKARTRAGNYTGKNAARKLLSKAYGASNNNKLLNSLGGGYGASKIKAIDKQDKEDIKESRDMIGDNDEIVNAIANDGFNEDSNAFRSLSEENQAQMRRMKYLGLDRKASTYLAAAEHMSENGMGTGQDINNLIQNAKINGARGNTIDNAYNSSLSNLKKAGRADSLFYLNNEAAKRGVRGVSEMKSMRDAFAKINPTSMSKYSLVDDGGYEEGIKAGESAASLNARGLFSGEDKKNQFSEMLQNENNRTILSTYLQHTNDITNPETQKLVGDEVIKSTSLAISGKNEMFKTLSEAQNHVREFGFNPAPTPTPPSPPPPSPTTPNPGTGSGG